MQQYAIDHDIMSTPRRMLVASYRGDKILLITPLLKWYLEHGLVVDHVYEIVEYERNACFQHFGESVSEARRAGDTDPNKAIIGKLGIWEDGDERGSPQGHQVLHGGQHVAVH